MPGSDDAFDTDGAARFIGCSPFHLKNLLSGVGGLIFYKLFRCRGIKYIRSDIDQWLLERRFGSKAEYPGYTR